jgi:ABC-type polysaccharide/polyol phosphate transport system ATPase subunit
MITAETLQSFEKDSDLIGPDHPLAAIALEKVSVEYRIPKERIPTFKEFAIRRLLRRGVEYHKFLALDQVSLTIRRGEVFGIIGVNGAGKSTLLKVVARVIWPTAGRARVRGRIAPLLELGAGFDSELTGRENIYLNSALLGKTRQEISERIEHIVEFAGVREFVNVPLRTYSSGMVARLGFAIATDIDPDILIVDEILSVGDKDFQKRSYERMRQLIDKGTTVLLVSHDMNAVTTLCQRVAWLESGHINMVGVASDVVHAYLQWPGQARKLEA